MTSPTFIRVVTQTVNMIEHPQHPHLPLMTSIVRCNQMTAQQMSIWSDPALFVLGEVPPKVITILVFFFFMPLVTKRRYVGIASSFCLPFYLYICQSSIYLGFGQYFLNHRSFTPKHFMVVHHHELMEFKWIDCIAANPSGFPRIFPILTWVWIFWFPLLFSAFWKLNAKRKKGRIVSDLSPVNHRGLHEKRKEKARSIHTLVQVF